MEEPPWKAPLRTALNHGGTRRPKRDRSEAKRKQVQVATVNTETGRPAVRTMVFRGFCSIIHDSSAVTSINVGGEGSASYPMLITDTRSGKYADFAGGSDCEICWWLDEAGVQIRLAGRVVVASPRIKKEPLLLKACKDVWDRLSDGTKRTFFWAEPGKPKIAADPVADVGCGGSGGSGGDGGGSSAAGEAAKVDFSIMSPYFALIIIVPDRVDELHLGGNQKRFIYSLNPQDSVGNGCAGTETVNKTDVLMQKVASWTVDEVNP